ncbi:MAG: hypothetical protein LAO06_09995 [Acidobacteriia bacterium]|nr:hypothetical protein [Terriglobia bacterium]
MAPTPEPGSKNCGSGSASKLIPSLPLPTKNAPASALPGVRSKEAGLELEEVKTLLRHENLATTSEVYGDLGMEAKRRIQQQLVNFVKQQATRIQ